MIGRRKVDVVPEDGFERLQAFAHRHWGLVEPTDIRGRGYLSSGLAL